LYGAINAFGSIIIPTLLSLLAIVIPAFDILMNKKVEFKVCAA
jgi:hypothetical protein